ncbi:hypothetical protein C5708_12175 [Caulobacter sp. CCUG 60055]|uniref:lysophospholipid acyltransferase family protein n=1 Tax=Caulobacter sp. CCUG 60055 TaxID=2100090 RepID=UPI001FA70D44|nr:lysophospholipid acyltransferase family protein [Caulobacter sp. CCUG 60055]MCI3181014.1 hypothetical protein [Caulobacter sp. CCUG 60055]
MRPLRSPWVVRTLSTLFSAYLRFVYATLRWTRDEQERAEAVWRRREETGAILCFWHARIPLSPNSWPQSPQRQDMRALISKSADGEFIAQTMEKIGFPSIRGSRQKQTDPAKIKGGSAAFRDMAKWVKGGGGIAITPDGPRGPAQVMGEGPPMLARLTGAPVLLVGMASRPCIRLSTWDRTSIPLPFGRAAMVWDGPFTAGGDADLAALGEDWGARLTAVTDRAEALLA